MSVHDFMVDEMERSVHDALCVVKRVLESHLVVRRRGSGDGIVCVSGELCKDTGEWDRRVGGGRLGGVCSQ